MTFYDVPLTRHTKVSLPNVKASVQVNDSTA